MGRSGMTVLLFLLIIIAASCHEHQFHNGCQETSDCETIWGKGSVCHHPTSPGSGVCSNPYHSGCLAALSPDAPLRVCNSEDGPEARCRQEKNDDLEVRIYASNWESSVMESWLLQIVLSELLGVAATIETGSPTGKLDLYDPWNEFEFGTPGDKEALKTGFELGDCRLASRNANNYQPCAHMTPESWELVSEIPWVQQFVYNGTIEQPGMLGVLGEEAWFVTKFAVVDDPSLASYLGLQNQRQKLADLFLRPTTWKDYCDQVSLDHCEMPDTVAQRAPATTAEGDRMFVQDLYTGHFRKTEENDCDLNPDTCTGHIGDYPCGWSSHVELQAHHLNISLRSSGKERNSRGYTSQQLADMWRAANATRSPLIMFWWRPEPLYQEFMGSDAAFQRVLLPPPTQNCARARLTPTDRCADDFFQRVGSPVAACDESPKQLEKLLTTSLYSWTHADDIPDGMRNPAYDVLKAFRLSALQQGELLEYSRRKRSPREAVCIWASENMDHLKTFIPRSYPRKLEEKEHVALARFSLTLASLAIVSVLFTAGFVYHRRNEQPIQLAQVEFLWVLLSGLLLLALGSFTQALRASRVSCLVSPWFILVGYTLELVPLIVKVAAINRLDMAARRFRRVVLKRRNLFLTVGCICSGVVLYMIVWTALDPPTEMPGFDLTNEVTAHGETVVFVRHHCSSIGSAWKYVGLGWHVLLLVAATVLAFQTQRVHKLVNECHTLAVMIYAHLLFVILRSICCLLSGYLLDSILKLLLSLIFSADTMVTLAIYFFPKLFFEHKTEAVRISSWSGELDGGAQMQRRKSMVTFAPGSYATRKPPEDREESPSDVDVARSTTEQFESADPSASSQTTATCGTQTSNLGEGKMWI